MQHRFKKRYVPARRAPAPKYARATRKSVGYAAAPKPPVAQEVKFFDSVFPQTTVPAGPASLIDSTLVAEIQNGTGPQSRIGRKIKVIKIDYSLTVILNGATSGASTDAMRYDIWLDKQCNGVAPGPAELYTALAGTPGTTQMPNLFNEKRFKRVYTKVLQFNPMGGVTATNQAGNVGFKFEGSVRPNCIIEYDASTGNITDLTSNNLFQCWSADSGFIVTQASFTRVHYVDA